MAGKSANTHGWAVDADLWAFVFKKVDDLGEENVRIFEIKAHRKIGDAIDAYDGMQIQANNRADALAKLGVEMHPDNYERRNECIVDAKKYVHIMKYMSKCLANSIDKGIYKDIQDQQLVLIAHAESKFDPGSLASMHFFTYFSAQSSRARCVKCFSTCSGVTRSGLCKGDVWAKGHRLVGIGDDLVFCSRCGAYSVGRANLLFHLCPGKPWSHTTKQAKTRMLGGLHPVTSKAIGDPIPLVRFFKPSLSRATTEDADAHIELDDITSILQEVQT